MDQTKRIADELTKLNHNFERIIRILEADKYVEYEITISPEEKEEKVTSTEPKVQIGSGGTYNQIKISEK